MKFTITVETSQIDGDEGYSMHEVAHALTQIAAKTRWGQDTGTLTVEDGGTVQTVGKWRFEDLGD